jgi:xylan 1,4-beta-xylosidase
MRRRTLLACAAPLVRPQSPADRIDAKTLHDGLRRHDRALHILSGWIRDPYIVLAPDGFFYLTGTTEQPGRPETGTDPLSTGLGPSSIVGWKVQVWRSRDLAVWQYLGAPFGLTDGVWAKMKPEAFAPATG